MVPFSAQKQEGRDAVLKRPTNKTLATMIDARSAIARWKPSWPALGGPVHPDRRGQDRARRPARHVLTYAATCRCASRPRRARREGIDAEIVDLRSLHPYDWNRDRRERPKTNRVLCVNEAPESRTSAST